MKKNPTLKINSMRPARAFSFCMPVFQGVALYLSLNTVHAQPHQPTIVKIAGCALEASATYDSTSPAASMWSLRVASPTSTLAQWDFTLSELPDQHYTNMSGYFSPKQIGVQQKLKVRGTLHKFDTYDEKVTLKNLELIPLPAVTGKRQATPRFLALQTQQSAVTPSGIRVTLPAQGIKETDPIFWNIGGNLNAVFIKIETTPKTRLVPSLPSSPLFQKYHRPETIKLEVAAPHTLVSYQADNTFPLVAVSIPKLATATRIDELTFIVRQRVELATFPINIAVPVANFPARKK